MSKIRVAFFGTPEYAAICLKSLLLDEHFEVAGVVTQPDRPAGRKLMLTPSAVKQVALSQGLKVLAPESLKTNPLIVDEIKSWRADVAVVVAFGQILTESFMSIFPFGCVNVHASLLPRWRGAAPIQRAIEAGDLETGVALQKMVKKLDAGDVLGFRKVSITPEMTALELHDLLAEQSKGLLEVELMDYVRGNLAGTPQDEAFVTYAKKIEKSESSLDLKQSAQQIHNKVRAFTWGPGNFVVYQGKKIKIHRTQVLDSLASLGSEVISAAQSVSAKSKFIPGQVVQADDKGLVIQTGQGLLSLLELQPESRNRQNFQEFLKGHPLKVGDQFEVASA